MLITRYNEAVQQETIKNNPQQLDIVLHLQRVLDELKTKRWFWFLNKKIIKGIYLWGSVGVGKTFLMDLFYNEVSSSKKMRVHFHHFMQQIDADLRALQGTKNPLQHIANQLLGSIKVLCLDEFLVEDVTIAMILAELMPLLLHQGMVVIITSNTKPDDLYLNGAARERFLPVIAMIHEYCEVLSLSLPTDYRMGRVSEFEAYLYPLTPETQQKLTVEFNHISKQSEHQSGDLMVQNRQISYLCCAQRVVWFRFDVLCNIPRSQLDYLELARRFDVLFISDIPQLSPDDTQQVVLFIRCVDVMYDAAVLLVLSAAVSLDALYVEGPMLESFQRTLSRLHEMQSQDYWARHVV